MNNEQPPQTIVKLKNVKIWIIMTIMPFVLLVLSMILSIVMQFGFNRVETSVCDGKQNSSGLSSGANLSNIPDACFETSSSDSPFKVGLKILQLLFGFSAVVLLLLEPLWIVMMILAIQYNNKLKS